MLGVCIRCRKPVLGVCSSSSGLGTSWCRRAGQEVAGGRTEPRKNVARTNSDSACSSSPMMWDIRDGGGGSGWDGGGSSSYCGG